MLQQFVVVGQHDVLQPVVVLQQFVVVGQQVVLQPVLVVQLFVFWQFIMS